MDKKLAEILEEVFISDPVFIRDNGVVTGVHFGMCSSSIWKKVEGKPNAEWLLNEAINSIDTTKELTVDGVRKDLHNALDAKLNPKPVTSEPEPIAVDPEPESVAVDPEPVTTTTEPQRSASAAAQMTRMATPQPQYQAPAPRWPFASPQYTSNVSRYGRGYTVDGNGDINVDLSAAITIDQSAQPYVPSVTQQIPTPQQQVMPPVAEVDTTEPPTTEVKPPRTRRSKSDVTDGAPKVTVTEADPMVDPTEDLIAKHNKLAEVRDWVGTEFEVKFEQVDDLFEMKVYSKETGKEIEGMAATLDINGCIFSDTAKFWAKSDSSDPVDFQPAAKLTEKGLTAYLAGEKIDESHSESLYNGGTGDINRIVDIRSFWNFAGITGNDVLAVIKRIKKEYEENEEFKKKLGDKRMTMTQFTDRDHFVLCATPKVKAYHNGPSNPRRTNIEFVFGDKDVSTK